MEFFDKVCVILSELSGIETICLEHELQSDLGLDSLQMVTLLMMLEENFQITLDESDMNPFDLTTVKDVVELANKYKGKAVDDEQIVGGEMASFNEDSTCPD